MYGRKNNTQKEKYEDKNLRDMKVYVLQICIWFLNKTENKISIASYVTSPSATFF